MSGAKSTPRSVIEAVQAVYTALEPFDEVARQRIIMSAASLLGASLPQPASQPGAGSVSISPSTPRVAASERPLSPVELLQDRKPATNAQKIALFAYYRERVEGQPRFAKEDLKQYFAKAKQLPPQNFDRDFRQAVRLGWIYEDGSDSYLTSKGLEIVEAGFDGKALPRGKRPKKAQPRSKSRPSAKK